MKKDFTQPFQSTPAIAISLIVETDTRHYVLEKPADPSLPDAYTLIQLDVDPSEDFALQLAKTLYSLGLIAVDFRELYHNQHLDFSFVDDTPGVIHHTKIFYVRAEVYTQKPELSYLSWDAFTALLDESPFTEDYEKEALRLL